MDFEEWKASYYEELAEKDWNKAYFMQPEKEAREALLKKRISSGEESEELSLIRELFEHRYTPVGKEPAQIDHAIRGIVNMGFLPETKKSMIKKKHFEKELHGILDDLGVFIAEKYGEAGQALMYDEMCNIVRKFVQLCREDKQYNAVLFGFGRIKPKTQSRKVARNLAQITFYVPRATGTEKEFLMLANAARQVFAEEYPKTAEDLENAIAGLSERYS